ncbi:MAG: response regulator [Saprospiraceae bacterium]|nr:response regulator [Lewinella sp.]
MKVLFVASHHGVEARLLSQFPEINWVPFESGRKQYDDLAAVLVLEPYECLGKTEREKDPYRGGLYTSVFIIWKRFLAFHYPKVKLLLGGFADIEHPNYINLLDLSRIQDFADQVEAAEPVTQDWNNLMPVRGEPIEDKLRLFFEGHNKEGIIITMAKVRQGLNHAYYDYGAREVTVGKFRDIWEEVLVPIQNYVLLMQRRWDNYAPYFENMPFFYQLEEVDVDGYLRELVALVEGPDELNQKKLKKKQKKFIAFDGFNRLDELQQALDLANKRYISPEVVGKVLVIDDDENFQSKLYYSFPVFEFDFVNSGKAGLGKASKKKYDLILLDLQLDPSVPELSGLNYIDSLKKLLSNTPLIIITTHAHKSVYAEAIQLGADNFLVKSEFDIRPWENLFIRTMSGQQTVRIPLPTAGRTVIDQEDGRAQVLVVEDDEDWFDRIKAIQGKSIQFHHAATQQIALDLLRDPKYDFDLVLLDLYLREEDRKEVLGGLKLIPKIIKDKPLIPIIVISRDWTYGMTLKAISQGASDYLRKDQFNTHLWHNRFKNYIELKKNRQIIEKMTNV